MVNLAHLIPVFPVIAFVTNILFGRKLRKSSALVSVSASVISLCLSVYTLIWFLKGQGSYTLFKWLIFGGTSLNIGVIVDPLTCMMLVVVSAIGTLIQIYSIGYMKDDVALLTVLRLYVALYEFDAGASPRRQFHHALHLLGRRRPLLISFNLILVRKTLCRQGRYESLHNDKNR